MRGERGNCRVWKGLGAMKDSRAVRRAESDGWGWGRGLFFCYLCYGKLPNRSAYSVWPCMILCV